LLEAIGLGQYADAFEANDIEMDLLKQVDDRTLKDIGVTSAGHRLRIRNAIAKLATAPRQVTQQPYKGGATGSLRWGGEPQQDVKHLEQDRSDIEKSQTQTSIRKSTIPGTNFACLKTTLPKSHIVRSSRASLCARAMTNEPLARGAISDM
jgi:hypothetical protein